MPGRASIKVSKNVKKSLEKVYDPKDHSHDKAVKKLIKTHYFKTHWLEVYIAIMTTIIAILFYLKYIK